MAEHHKFNYAEDLREKVLRVVTALSPHLAEFDCIAVTGASGYVGAAAAFLLNKKLAVIRKDNSVHCNSRDYSSTIPDHSVWVFVDDFCDSGATYNRVLLEMGKPPAYAVFYDAEKTVGFKRFGANIAPYLAGVNQKEKP